MIRYLSLFSGIEAPTVAWGKAPLNWEAVAFAEIDKYCNQLLSYYYPSVPNLGDITKITEEQIKDLGQIDLVIFTSICGFSNRQRYKMLGNSIVVNVLRWIGERIEYSLSHQLTE